MLQRCVAAWPFTKNTVVCFNMLWLHGYLSKMQLDALMLHVAELLGIENTAAFCRSVCVAAWLSFKDVAACLNGVWLHGFLSNIYCALFFFWVALWLSVSFYETFEAESCNKMCQHRLYMQVPLSLMPWPCAWWPTPNTPGTPSHVPWPCTLGMYALCHGSCPAPSALCPIPCTMALCLMAYTLHPSTQHPKHTTIWW